jgi:xylan 1,4-beta-xylosidase
MRCHLPAGRDGSLRVKSLIANPVLPGFHPDPSILRVDEDYYLATSTFEWFPGVALYHSRDLARWRPIGHALTRISQLDLTAVPDSGGVWAPSLSHSDGRFWLVYTVMRTRTGPYKDMANLLVTAESIAGPWSEPVYLNSRGFDPSLFHDEDGRKWLVQIQWDHRKDHPSFGGIVLQEYDPSALALRGEAVRIHQKEGLIEGPNIYKRNGCYHLLLAEGGTSWNHAVSLVRSRDLFGPYESDPQDVVLTSRDRPELVLQKAGHGELVETPSGSWVLAHLASRPLSTPAGPRCPLGRETCLQNVVWSDDGWLRLATGGTAPALQIEARLGFAGHEPPAGGFNLNPAGLGPEWMTLRIPRDPGWADLTSRPGWLRLRGQESPASLHTQSLVARRVTDFHFQAEVRLDFQPATFSQMAGLICYYDTKTHFYFRVTGGIHGRRVLGVVTMQDGKYEELGDEEISPRGEITLRVDWQAALLQFSFADETGAWKPLGPKRDASVLSDDFGTGLHFTGAFVGICAQDLAAHTATADFTDFRYTPETGSFHQPEN